MSMTDCKTPSRRTVVCALAMPLALAACSRGTGFILDDVSLADARSMEDQALVMLNAFRQQNDRNALSIDNALARAAANQSTIMLRKQTMKHEFGPSTRFKKRLRDADVESRIAAENIAVGQYDVKRVIQAWIDSRPHRKNMLLERVDRFGIAMRTGPNNRRWWTLIVAG